MLDMGGGGGGNIRIPASGLVIISLHNRVLIMAFHEPWNSNEWNPVRLDEVSSSEGKVDSSIFVLPFLGSGGGGPCWA